MIWATRNVSSMRDFSRWGEPIILNSLLELSNHKFIDDSSARVFSMIEDGAIVDFRLSFSKNKPLVVFFNGAQNRNVDYKFPSFSGLKVTPLDKASLLCINDPSLYMSDDIKMAWYAGSKNTCLQEKIIPALVGKIYKSISATSLIFVGGSAGGTASLFYAKKFPDSFCIASNPQTDIFKYSKPHVNRYLRNCFGIKNIETAKKFPEMLNGVVTNIADYYSGSVNNFTLYLQNKEDYGHFDAHYCNFITSLGLKAPQKVGSHQITDKLLVELGDWGEGHKSAPREFWANMLNNVLESEGEWDTLFKEKRAHELLLPS